MSTTAHPSRTLVASVAGGPARHFRVQVLPADETTWRLFASYSNQKTARLACEELLTQGMMSRVIAVRIFPTAA